MGSRDGTRRRPPSDPPAWPGRVIWSPWCCGPIVLGLGDAGTVPWTWNVGDRCALRVRTTRRSLPRWLGWSSSCALFLSSLPDRVVLVMKQSLRGGAGQLTRCLRALRRRLPDRVTLQRRRRGRHGLRLQPTPTDHARRTVQDNIHDAATTGCRRRPGWKAGRRWATAWPQASRARSGTRSFVGAGIVVLETGQNSTDRTRGAVGERVAAHARSHLRLGAETERLVALGGLDATSARHAGARRRRTDAHREAVTQRRRRRTWNDQATSVVEPLPQRSHVGSRRGGTRLHRVGAPTQHRLNVHRRHFSPTHPAKNSIFHRQYLLRRNGLYHDIFVVTASPSSSTLLRNKLLRTIVNKFHHSTQLPTGDVMATLQPAPPTAALSKSIFITVRRNGVDPIKVAGWSPLTIRSHAALPNHYDTTPTSNMTGSRDRKLYRLYRSKSGVDPVTRSSAASRHTQSDDQVPAWHVTRPLRWRPVAPIDQEHATVRTLKSPPTCLFLPNARRLIAGSTSGQPATANNCRAQAPAIASPRKETDGLDNR